MCFLLVFQKSSSFCRENEILKKKQKNNLDQFLTYKKGNLGPVFNSTAYIYMYRERSLMAQISNNLRKRQIRKNHWQSQDCRGSSLCGSKRKEANWLQDNRFEKLGWTVNELFCQKHTTLRNKGHCPLVWARSRPISQTSWRERGMQHCKLERNTH